MTHADRSARVPWLAAGIAASWTFLVVDFLLHAVALASWWRETGDYWLPPMDLFRRIPFGYASFVIYVAVLVGLLIRLHGGRPGLGRAARFGALAGAIGGVAWTLATYSVFAMPGSALIVWPASTILESTLAATTGAWVLAAARPRRRVTAVLGAGLLLLVAGVVAQNVLLAAP